MSVIKAKAKSFKECVLLHEEETGKDWRLFTLGDWYMIAERYKHE